MAKLNSISEIRKNNFGEEIPNIYELLEVFIRENDLGNTTIAEECESGYIEARLFPIPEEQEDLADMNKALLEKVRTGAKLSVDDFRYIADVIGVTWTLEKHPYSNRVLTIAVTDESSFVMEWEQSTDELQEDVFYDFVVEVSF